MSRATRLAALSSRLALGILLAVASFAPASARAASLDEVRINGFGSLMDGVTNRNEYLAANSTASRVQSSFALAIGARPLEQLNVFGQIRAQGINSDLSMELDWAFAEWSFAEALRLRAGRCKLPLGFYSETRDVGTLRPFLSIPQSVYGLLEMSAEAYNGVGLTGDFELPRGWGLSYDLFAGDMFASLNRTPDYAREGPPPMQGDVTGSNTAGAFSSVSLAAKLAGLRLGLATPLEGLRFFAAGYYGDEKDSATDLTVGGLGAEFLRESFSARLEGFLVYTTDDTVSRGSYLELAYYLTQSWQVALRGELSRVSMADAESDSSLLHHREAAAGLNYWFSPNLVLKSSLHLVDGNLFAQPSDLTTAIAQNTLEPRTLAFELGAQFSF